MDDHGTWWFYRTLLNLGKGLQIQTHRGETRVPPSPESRGRCGYVFLLVSEQDSVQSKHLNPTDKIVLLGDKTVVLFHPYFYN